MTLHFLELLIRRNVRGDTEEEGIPNEK